MLAIFWLAVLKSVWNIANICPHFAATPGYKSLKSLVTAVKPTTLCLLLKATFQVDYFALKTQIFGGEVLEKLLVCSQTGIHCMHVYKEQTLIPKLS